MKRVRNDSLNLGKEPAGANKKFRRSKRFAANPKATVQNVNTLIQNAIYRTSETKISSTILTEDGITTIDPVATTLFVPLPSQGVQANQRIGNKISGVGIQSKFVLHNNTENWCWFRLLLLKVHQGEMTGSEIANELFEGTGDQTVGESGAIGEIIRKVDREFFTVLRDVTIPLGPLNQEKGTHIFSHYQKLDGHPMKFNDKDNTKPVNDNFVWVMYARQANADESLGSTIEATAAVDFYYKD